ncbi:hypothetical protein AAAV73_00885, partial [Hominicoprocola fusiformis]|nr:hypothetical protein [Hominicoprocola fusiformis]
RARSGAPIVPLPRNRLASSATGGASPISMCVRKNASQPANVRAFGACAAAGCNPPQKAALPLFLKLIAMI